MNKTDDKFLGPDHLREWQEILAEKEACTAANPVLFEQVKAVYLRYFRFVQMAYEAYDLDPTQWYDMNGFTGHIKVSGS
jgi:hypothetical protein